MTPPRPTLPAPIRHARPGWAWRALLGGAAALLGAGAATAAPVIARYEVHAAGLTVMRVEARFELDMPGGLYRVSTRIRTTGLVGLFSQGDQTTSVEGQWRGNQPMPLRYRVAGTWRGAPRQVAIDWQPADGMPVVGALVPPNEGDRQPVPPELQRATMDGLSALAKLTRTVAETGRCDAEARVFDGRRRADYQVRTIGLEPLPPRDCIGGEALRCAFESRLVAGIRADQDPEEARRPQPATAWLARVAPAAMPVPVRIELPSRWFGTIRAELVGLELGGAPAPRDQLVQQRR